MIFGKLFGRKKKDDSRISSIERFEKSTVRPIIFKTEHGGSRPLQYNTNIEKVGMMKEESLEYLQKAIENECIDEYSDLSIFYDMVRKRSIIVQNELKNQNINRKEVGDNIKIVTEETLCQLERKEKLLEEERKNYCQK